MFNGAGPVFSDETGCFRDAFHGPQRGVSSTKKSWFDEDPSPPQCFIHGAGFPNAKRSRGGFCCWVDESGSGKKKGF